MSFRPRTRGSKHLLDDSAFLRGETYDGPRLYAVSTNHGREFSLNGREGKDLVLLLHYPDELWFCNNVHLLAWKRHGEDWRVHPLANTWSYTAHLKAGEELT